MKLQILAGGFARVLSLIVLFSALSVAVADSSDEVPANSAGRGALQLSYGAANVLKLSQAKIGEDIIVSYIQSSGLSYSVAAADIIYLHEEGVSSRVISTMLTEQKKFNDLAAQTAVPSTPPTSAQLSTAPATTVVQPYAPSSVSYAQPAQSPTVIVMRDSSPRLVDYGIYPFYGNSFYPRYGYEGYGHSYPSASFSIGFGAGHFGTGYRGGFHRGGYYRGCWR